MLKLLTGFIVLVLSYNAWCQPSSVTGDSLNYAVKPKFRWVFPALLITTGTIAALDKDADESIISNYEVWEERNEKFINFSTRTDDYMQHIPAATAFVLSLSGVEGRNDLPNQAALYLKSELLMLVTVYAVKYSFQEKRPDTGTKNSFPSGHTAQAFMAATFLSKEYGQKSVWYSIGAYTMASTVGVFRMLNNRHWISDVLVGAGIGILSTNVVYATHQYKWGKRKPLALSIHPYGFSGSYGVHLTLKL